MGPSVWRSRLFGALAVAFLVLSSGAALGRPNASRLYPNLRPLAPAQVYGPETGVMPFSTTTVTPVVVDGCLPEEIARGARRCLRFDTLVLNDGRGPLEVAYLVDDATVDALQRIYRSDGTIVERRATTSEFHPTHTHFHIKDFYVSRLWRASREGVPRGNPVATTLKNGFCPEDSEQHMGIGERRYSCRTEYESEGGVRQIVGISPGWSDAYRYHLPDQFLEISDVPDGRYVLKITIDPNDNFRESNEHDNSVCVGIVLSGATIDVDRFAAGASCRHDGMEP